MRNTGRAITLLLGLIPAAPAGAVDLAASATLSSDYRFRGLSLSNRQPVVEAGVDASAGSWFAGVEAISGAEVRAGRLNGRRNAEVDVSAGWTRAFGLLTPTAGVIAYVHPGGGEAANAELFGTVAGALGPAALTVGANYAPSQSDLRGGDFYVYAKAVVGIPLTPVSLNARVGREAGAYVGGGVKVDYLAGAEVKFGIVTLGLDYSGNDLPRSAIPVLQRRRDGGVVASIGVAF